MPQIAPMEVAIESANRARSSLEQKFLLGSRDAGGDLGIQVFSAQAPLGAAVIGHKAGDKLSFEAPTGRMIEVEILDAKPFEG